MSPDDPVVREPGRTRRLVLRALRLHCPNCNGGPLFDRWVRMRPACPRCGMRTERGESDYFVGAYVVNLIIAELLLGLMIVATLLATWPDPPWELFERVGAVLMVLLPLFFYPFSKTVWLAVDLAVRPLVADDFPAKDGRPRPA